MAIKTSNETGFNIFQKKPMIQLAGSPCIIFSLSLVSPWNC